jgi:hypothetical protein
MPRAVYDKVMELPMPMPILKPAELFDKEADLQYLSFAYAKKMPFTNKYHPSLEVTAKRVAATQNKKAADQFMRGSRFTSAIVVMKLKNKASFKIGVATKVRGVVECNQCSKPRCIYSQYALSNMRPPLPRLDPDNDTTTESPTDTAEEVRHYIAMAREKLEDAMESPIYICGMAPLDPYDSCFDIFLCDTTLDCDKHVEAEFYVSKIQQSRLESCFYCARVFNSPIELNTSPKAPEGPYSLVLPICKACMESGCNIVVRSARQNAKAKHARMDLDRDREALRTGAPNVEEVLAADEAREVAAPTTTLTKKKRNVRSTHRYIC